MVDRSALMFWGWWGCLDWRLRYALAIGVMSIAGWSAWSIRSSEPADSYRSPIIRQPDHPARRDYRGPMMFGALGFVMLMFAGRSKAETLGYQDF